VKGKPRAEHRVRSSVGSALYERILREAAARRLSVSHTIRADLQELYAIRDELARPIEVGAPATGKGSPLLHRLLAETETRLAADLGRQLTELDALRAAVRRLEAMLDRHYVGLMLYLPDVPADSADARARGALRRYEAWKEAVAQLLRSSDEPA
jgi:hypothetical protein